LLGLCGYATGGSLASTAIAGKCLHYKAFFTRPKFALSVPRATTSEYGGMDERVNRAVGQEKGAFEFASL
jgi:hypothetical protein